MTLSRISRQWAATSAAVAALAASGHAQQVLYSHGDPTALEQQMLEYVNRARANPTQEGIFLDTIDTWYSRDARARKPSFFTNLRAEFAAFPAVQPLAFHPALIQAARAHSQDMVARNYLSHVNPNGQTPSARAAAAGYDTSVGENIDGGGAATGNDVLHSHFAFMVDYDNLDTSNPLGHRVNVMTGSYSEAGIGIAGQRSGGRITQDFGSPARNYIVGVASNDANNNGRYDAGEGLAGITVGPDTGNWFAVTSASGGFAIPIDPIQTVSDTVNVPFPVQGSTWANVQPYDTAYRQQQLAAAPNMTVNLAWSGGALTAGRTTSVTIKRPVLRNYRIKGTDDWSYNNLSMVTTQNAKADLTVLSPGGGTPPGAPGNPSDFNSDGKADLIFQNNAGNVASWLMNGAGGVTGVQWIYRNSIDDWKIVATTDVDRDGDQDIVFQNNAGQVVAWFMDGNGNFTGAKWISTSSAGDWKIVAAIDVDGNGFHDFVFQNNAGQVVSWILDGSGNLIATQWIYPNSTADWKIAAAADMNSDGKLDLIFQNNAGQVVAWLMDGLGNMTGIKWIYTLSIADWKIATALDVDGDGKHDLVFQNNAGQVVSWIMDGAGNFIRAQWIYTGSTGDWRIR